VSIGIIIIIQKYKFKFTCVLGYDAVFSDRTLPKFRMETEAIGPLESP
jgi:hypothetical protein